VDLVFNLTGLDSPSFEPPRRPDQLHAGGFHAGQRVLHGREVRLALGETTSTIALQVMRFSRLA